MTPICAARWRCDLRRTAICWLPTRCGQCGRPAPERDCRIHEGGEFVREYNVDSSPGGAFGLDTVREGPFNYAVIDDVTNTLSVYRLEDR